VRYITKDDIEKWGKSVPSKGDLPRLIFRLVYATTPMSTEISLPGDSGVFSDGYDGIVNCEEKRTYVPKGTSVWEFGTTKKGVTKKADEDYEKRSTDPLGIDPKESTFVFLTPSNWRDKKKWRDAKMAEGIWKDIKVYDSRDIAEWLEMTAATSKWFAGLLGKVQEDGTQTLEEFWKEWSRSPKYEWPPHATVPGRTKQVEQLLAFLEGPENVIGIRASTKEEAIAFVVCSVKQSNQTAIEKFFSKSLIIETQGQFRTVSQNFLNPLNLIPRFSERSALYAAVSQKHHVLVPLGPDDEFDYGFDIIDLPGPDPDGLSMALTDMGIDREQAQKYVQESGQNITILRRLLKFPSNKFNWMETENHKDFLPALMLGRWNEELQGDREIIERLSGKAYDEYDEILSKWKDFEASPILKIGSTWRLTSFLTFWADFSAKLTKRDFDKLETSFFYAFKNGNPDVETQENVSRPFLSKKKMFSSWAREGLTQSLILVGLFGKNLQITKLSDPQHWVDGIINTLLADADSSLWVSINREAPLIAEASPSKFLGALENAFSKPENPISSMFIEEESNISFSPTSNHTGLLWALESLAWLPEYFHKSTYILLRLAEIDPGGRLSNRPMNSLVEIFKTWHVQTLVTYQERMDALQSITEKIPDTGWKLLIKLLPDYHGGIAYNTHKLRWRMFEKPSLVPFSRKEQNDSFLFVLELLTKKNKYSEDQLNDLLHQSVKFPIEKRKDVLSFIQTQLVSNDIQSDRIWDSVRKIMVQHRLASEAAWSLTEQELEPYEGLYKAIEPTDLIKKYLWLFDDNWPQSPERAKHSSRNRNFEDEQKAIDQDRLRAAEDMVNHVGIEKVIGLATKVKFPWSLGYALGSLNDERAEKLVFDELQSEPLPVFLIHSFVVRKVQLNGLNWVLDKANFLTSQNKVDHVGQLFVPLTQTKEMFELLNQTSLDVQNEYWNSMEPHFYNLSAEDKEYGIVKLLEVKRYITALNASAHFPRELSTDVLVITLLKTATETPSEKRQIESYYISEIFTELDERDNIERSVLINLEWLYLQILGDHGSRRKPKHLHKELATNPQFFVDILKYVFLGKNKKEPQVDPNTPPEVAKMRATQGFQLLYRWKLIPGTKDDGTIDELILNDWVDSVRELAKQADRLEVADMQIGTVLAQYPEKADHLYPPEEISRLIERINTKSIKSNYSAALYNKRGTSSRGLYDGGEIERDHAKFFDGLAKLNRAKYPNVAEIFSGLAKGYLYEAKEQDETARRDRLEFG
jgi:hypothetical protein